MPKSNKPALTVADLQVAFLTGGVAKVQNLPTFKAHKDPRPALKNVIKSLGNYPGVDTAPLAALLESMNAEKRGNRGGRGIPAPQVGGTYDRKVQARKNKKGETVALYVAVPIPEGSIEVTEGDTLSMKVENGRIVLC